MPLFFCLLKKTVKTINSSILIHFFNFKCCLLCTTKRLLFYVRDIVMSKYYLSKNRPHSLAVRSSYT